MKPDRDGADVTAQDVHGKREGRKSGTYRTPIFLSYPKPYERRQEQFIEQLRADLRRRGFAPRTLGVTEYNLRAPLQGIRKIMLESYGIITIAFRRTYLEKAEARVRTERSLEPRRLNKTWTTTPWPHIEAAMAYQVGLPIMILREKGVEPDGVLEKGVVGLYTPEFDLDADADGDGYLRSREWRHLVREWESEVRATEKHRWEPPRLY